jgi:hypothetical protein|tara:strand:+ start:112 stop:324 length:213 start_codon:yes stop_codon:yes gene_type:complete
MKNKALILFLVLTLLLVFAISGSLGHKTKGEILPLPEFIHCSCDSATFCLNNEDVIKLHMWYENVKWGME